MFLESSPDYERATANFNLPKQFGFVLLLSALAYFSTGCAGISNSAPSQSPTPSNKISLSPATLTINSGAQQQFAATSASGNSPFLWSASAGTISNKGLFTAPSVTSSTKVKVTATTAANPASVAISEVTIVPLNQITINVSPATASIPSGGKQQFSATLTSTSNTAVSWKASAGTISSSGLFTAPSVTSSTTLTVTATSSADKSVVATSQVTVAPLTKLSLATHTLPAGTAGNVYSATLTASGGTAPYAWQIVGGSLPQGLSLDKSNGVISGTTALAGTFSFTASVTDTSSTAASAALSLVMNAQAASGNFDGPAELPRVYVQSDLADTPAPGSVISVTKNGDFQAALNRAQCGDTIELPAGAVYAGKFTVPALSCDDAHWIIVRTNAADSSLPPEGTRITPCYAGVSSLPGRPALNCSSTSNVLAKIEFPGVGSGPLLLAAGANHYRFIGLEITRPASANVVYNLVSNPDGSADHIILDRSWIHGTAQDETTRGVMLAGTQFAAIIDSYLNDFHCVSITGSCGDSQAIAGGSGDLPMGPFKIVDNFLEAASQSILLGGGEATVTPADIEIRRNHMFKPMTWLKGQPGYVGGRDGNPFIVKNLLELKNAQRVLFDGNVLENTWGGFSQAGFGILLTPKNQAGKGGGNLCPACQVTDVTIRYSTVSHVGGGMQIANGLSDNGGAALAGERYSIHDITIDDIDPTKFDGYGSFAQVSMGPGAALLQSVTINHVTAFQPHVMLNLGDDISVNRPMVNFVFTNNILNAGTTPTQTTGGGTTNCAYYSAPLTSLGSCFQPYTFSHNAIIASPSNYPPSKYPSGNHFPASVSGVNFMNYKNGNGGDYHLQSASPFKNAGTDGKDLGADINAIDTEIAGVP